MNDRRAPRDQARINNSNSSNRMSASHHQQHQLRLQREAAERRDFTNQLVSAIGEAARRRAQAPWPELAARAYDKLQYDLPLVGADELRALLHAFCVALDGKAGMPPFPLTGKFVVNVVAGARAGAEGGAAASGSASAPAPSSSSALIYRHLCAVMALPLVARLLASPEEAAWEALAPLARAAATGFDGEHEEEEEEEELEEDEEGSGAAAALAAAAAASAAAAAADRPPEQQQEDDGGERMAAVMDSDGDAYEDIAPLPPGPSALAQGLGALSLGGGGSSTARHHRQQQRPPPPPYDGDWAALRGLLVSLASLAEHSLGEGGGGGSGGGAAAAAAAPAPAPGGASSASLWVRGAALAPPEPKAGGVGNGKHAPGCAAPLNPSLDAGAHLLAALRAAGAHPRGTEELAPVAATLLSALVDRTARDPADGVALLEGAWDALLGSVGAAAGGAVVVAPLPPRATTTTTTSASPLPAEATLAMGSAVAAGARLLARSAAGGGSATTAALRRLWSLVDARLLPLVERCADALAHPPAPQGAAASADEGAALASALLVAQALELYVRARPEGVDAGARLAERGLLRPLALLFARHASSPAAEPLRRTVLLAAVSSPAARNWLCAVPAVVEAARGLLLLVEEEEVDGGDKASNNNNNNNNNNNSAAAALTAAHAVLWRALLLPGGAGPTTTHSSASSLLRVLERGAAALEQKRPASGGGGGGENGGGEQQAVVVESAANGDDGDSSDSRSADIALLLAAVSLLADARHARRAALPLPADIDAALRSLLAGAVRACAAASAAASAAAAAEAEAADGADRQDSEVSGDDEEEEDDPSKRGRRDDGRDDDTRGGRRDVAAVEARRALRLNQGLVRALKEIAGPAGGGRGKCD